MRIDRQTDRQLEGRMNGWTEEYDAANIAFRNFAN
jgi:hypothetical protein